MFDRLKKFFIPHRENEYKPEFFREWSVLIVGTVILALFLIASFLQYNLQVNSSLMANVISSVMVDLTNEDRSESGLSRLAVNDQLVKAAELKAQDMAQEGYFAHTSPDGETPWVWFEEAEYDFQHAGENLAVHFSDSRAVEEAWMNSPTHRANILDERFTEIGIATAEGEYDGYDTTFVVQMFGTPKRDTQVQESEPSQTQEQPEERETEPAEEPTTVLGSAAQDEPSDQDDDQQETPVEIATSSQENQQFVAVTSQESIAGSTTGPIQRAAASPQSTLKQVLFGIAIFVVLCLLVMIGIEIKRQHVRHIMYGLLLLLLIVSLLYITQGEYITQKLLIL